MIPVLIAMLFYGLLHSWLAGSQLKQLFRTRFGDRAYYGLYRLIFNILAAIGLLPISWLFVFYPDGILWKITPQFEPILMFIQIIGLVGATISLLQIDLWRFAGVRQLIAYLTGQPLPLPEEPLQMKGLYAFVRHPLYLFSIMAMLPVMTMTGAYFGFCIGAIAYFTIGSLYEERRLVKVYGPEYEAYRRRVPWLLPVPRGQV